MCPKRLRKNCHKQAELGWIWWVFLQQTSSDIPDTHRWTLGCSWYLCLSTPKEVDDMSLIYQNSSNVNMSVLSFSFSICNSSWSASSANCELFAPGHIHKVNNGKPATVWLLAAQDETWISCSQGHSSLHLAVPDPTDLGGVESSCEDHSWGVGAFDVSWWPSGTHRHWKVIPASLESNLEILTTKSTGQRCNGTAHLRVHGLWAPPCQSSQPGGFLILSSNSWSAYFV